jgi:hypothetical protein
MVVLPFNHIRTLSLLLKGSKSLACAHAMLMEFEQGGILIMPHLL